MWAALLARGPRPVWRCGDGFIFVSSLWASVQWPPLTLLSLDSGIQEEWMGRKVIIVEGSGAPENGNYFNVKPQIRHKHQLKVCKESWMAQGCPVVINSQSLWSSLLAALLCPSVYFILPVLVSQIFIPHFEGNFKVTCIWLKYYICGVSSIESLQTHLHPLKSVKKIFKP